MTQQQTLSERSEEKTFNGAYLFGLLLTALSGFLVGLSVGLSV